LIILFPALAILTFVSSQTGINDHMRYALPICPYFCVWIGRVAVAFTGRQRIMQVLVVAALGWSITSSLWIYPHNLSYFNEIAGGPTGGPTYLLGSNVDWGQDLLFLKGWIANHPNAKPLRLACYGGADPSALGIESSDFDNSSDNARGPNQQPLRPGWYAISVNMVHGDQFSVYDSNGKRIWIDSATRETFRCLEPIDRVGYSILIYHLATAPTK
jgi:hypothetical protein